MNDFRLSTDDDREVWVWVSRFGDIHTPGGAVIHLNADEDAPERNRLTADTAMASLAEWYDNYQPAMIREHAHKGHADGVARGPTRRLTPEQMAELVTPEMLPEHAAKLRNQTDDGFFALFRLTDPETARQYLRGQLSYTSPHVQVGQTDDTGKVWPVIHREVSLTTGPVQTSQIPMPALMNVRLSHNQGIPMTDTTDTPEPPVDETAALAPEEEDRMATLEAQVETMAAQIGQLLELVQAMAPEVEPDQPTEDEEMANLRASLASAQEELSTVKADSRRAEATAHVAKLSLTTEARAELVELAATNPEGYALSIKHVPALTPDQPKDAPPFEAALSIEPHDNTPHAEHAAIKAHQREIEASKGIKLSFPQARASYRAAANGGR